MTHFKRPAGQTTYRAFLVRLWSDASQETWYASAQPVQSGEVMRFATLQALFAYLEDETNRNLHDAGGVLDAKDNADRPDDE